MKLLSKTVLLVVFLAFNFLLCPSVVRSDDDLIDDSEDDAVVNEEVPVQSEEVVSIVDLI
jgi:hypothetical protein